MLESLRLQTAATMHPDHLDLFSIKQWKDGDSSFQTHPQPYQLPTLGCNTSDKSNLT